MRPDVDDEEDLDERIEEMSLNTLNMNGQSDVAEDAVIFSNVGDSKIDVFNEDIVEDELSQADVRPSHTPWNMIGLGVGGSVLMVIVVA